MSKKIEEMFSKSSILINIISTILLIVISINQIFEAENLWIKILVGILVGIFISLFIFFTLRLTISNIIINRKNQKFKEQHIQLIMSFFTDFDDFEKRVDKIIQGLHPSLFAKKLTVEFFYNFIGFAISYFPFKKIKGEYASTRILNNKGEKMYVVGYIIKEDNIHFNPEFYSSIKEIYPVNIGYLQPEELTFVYSSCINFDLKKWKPVILSTRIEKDSFYLIMKCMVNKSENLLIVFSIEESQVSHNRLWKLTGIKKEELMPLFR